MLLLLQLSLKIKSFRVIATGFTANSDKLLDKGILPSSKKLVKYFLWFRVHFKVFLSSLDW